MPASLAALGMIADDLTGGCDASVPFAERGLSALVWLAAGTPPAADLLVLITGGRSMTPAAAREAAKAACRRLRAFERRLVYLKIDSTFRGNPGAEILGVMEEASFRLAVVSPAFPAMGRIVERGRLHVTGMETTVHLASRLAGQGIACVVELGASDYAELRRLRCDEPTVVIADAGSQDDLERLVAVLISLDPVPLPAGSAGLALELARRLAPARSPERLAAPSHAPPGPVLFVIGSTHPATQAQLVELQQAGAAMAGPAKAEELGRALREGRHAVLLLEPSRVQPDEIAALVTLVRTCRVRGLVLSGGDTASSVLAAVPARGIRLERQVQLGIPFGRLAGGVLDGFPVVTKAGGFGGPDALAGCARFLSAMPPVE